MEGLEQALKMRPEPPDAIACTMYFAKPGEDQPQAISGFPQKTGFVDAGEGLEKLAYGSVIYAYRRSFLEKLDDSGPNTADVYFGFLAAVGAGLYVVCNPQHVHVQHSALDNMGFGGKLLAAEGDEALRLAELNHFQLLQLYDATLEKALEITGGKMQQAHYNAGLNMILGQSKGWLEARKVLHAKGITPAVM